MLSYTLKYENGGWSTYADTVKKDWSLAGLKTNISVLVNTIHRLDLEGGTITVEKEFGHPRELIIVEGCPTKHANIVEDFMGGQVCLDCKAVW